MQQFNADNKDNDDIALNESDINSICNHYAIMQNSQNETRDIKMRNLKQRQMKTKEENIQSDRDATENINEWTSHAPSKTCAYESTIQSDYNPVENINKSTSHVLSKTHTYWTEKEKMHVH